MPNKLKRKALHLNSNLTANAVITNKSIYGADHIVVEGAGSIICDTVMNEIYYIKEEVVALANRTNSDIHAPSGHPVDEKGNFISAGHPMATQQNFIGGISNNYRMNGDRLVRDIAINPEIANRSDDGKEIIRRIDKNEDTDTSTGLLLNLEEKSGIGNDGEPYKFIARNMELDHDAILLRERGAATSLQGVGMFANSKGDEFDVDEYTINASFPAMQLPLAPADHVWNESAALARIKTFTNSDKKPSTNFRKFFLNFDQDNVDSFDSYTNLFADVIDGVPHAVKAPIESATNNANAQAYNQRFAANKDGFITKAINVLKSIFKGNELSHSDIHEAIFVKLNEGRQENRCNLWPMDVFQTSFVYRGENDTMFRQSYAIDGDDIVFIGERTEVERVVEYIPVTNDNGDRIMREKILKALNAAKVKTEGLDDDALFAAYNELNKAQKGDKDDQSQANTELEKVLASVNTLTEKVDTIQTSLKTNADDELNALAKQVGELDKGITEDTAKTMGVNALKEFLAKSGVPAFNTSGGQQQQNNSEDGCSSLTLPTSTVEAK